MKIIIETIPHDKQRYPTIGDWQFQHRYSCPDPLCCLVPPVIESHPKELACPNCGKPMVGREELNISVSQLSDWRREMLIAVHELVEVLICKHRGISQESVDDFDKKFEETRHPDNEDEPGDDPAAPYAREHGIATGIERIMAAELDVNWKDYGDEVCGLH